MIPVVCPKCGHPALRLHASIYDVTMRPLFFLFGPMRYHRTIVGHDCSCRKCFYAFTSERGTTLDAPAQTMHEAVGVNRVKEREAEKPERKPAGYDRDVQPDPRDPQPR